VTAKSIGEARVEAAIAGRRRTWLVTGAAGFIGSHLVERLLRLDQAVVGLDNFATGKRANLDGVRLAVGPDAASRFRFIEGDITVASTCNAACAGVDVILHQAALGSVPRSIAAPLPSHATNLTGFVNMLEAAKAAGIKRFVYASSSSVYGTEPALPKVEQRIGDPLSPYAVTKLANELYAGVFARCYGMETIGLRYFNVFGPRQDPEGPYAAVIPRWVDAMLSGGKVVINGDGETSRDFCYVANAVQANLLAASTEDERAFGQAFNVAVGARTTLDQLHGLLKSKLMTLRPGLVVEAPVYGPFRPGDVRHSEADVSRARELLGYAPSHTIADGLNEALPWYVGSRRADVT
jgi:UDP-N-acetylglucosamine 4-epimerase